MNEWPPDTPAARLIGVARGVEQRLEAALEPLGLSLAKFGALAQLAGSDEPLPLGTLAARCACVKSNITQLVDRLETERLVKRVSDPGDRRSTLAELTPEGRKRHAAGRKALHAAERTIFDALPNAERDALLRMLSALESPA